MSENVTRAVALSALLAAACAERPASDFQVHGAEVSVRTSAPFAHRGDLPARVEAALSAALGYWGGSWDDLAGAQIVLLDGPYVPCAGSSHAVGCYDGELRISASDPGAGTFSCVEQTVLVHEVGHAVIGDRLHTDPRWMDFEAVLEALSGRSGYTADGETDCPLFTSVWRHPPDAP